jgi:hypothetical protein
MGPIAPLSLLHVQSRRYLRSALVGRFSSDIAASYEVCDGVWSQLVELEDLDVCVL